MSNSKRIIAIVGVGPRGAYALESYILELSKRKILNFLNILLFDTKGAFGYGPVYGLNQNDANWLNTPEHIIILDSRPALQASSKF